MDTYTPDRREEEDQDGYRTEPGTESQGEAPLPRRRRRQFFNRRTAALGALVTCAIGFYAGIRVEKGQLSNSSTSSGAASGRAAALAARFGTSGATSAGATGRFAGGGLGGAGASFGTVASVKGKTIYVTDANGNTVKVKVTASTKITKNQSASRHAIRPGDTIIVSGGSTSGGVTSAATITDSGNRGGSGGGSRSGGGSGSPGGGASSAVGSLFSSGG